MGAPAATMAGGQRRQAMLQRAGAPAQPPKLSMDDVRTLQQDRSPEARAVVARKFGEQFDELAAGGHAELANAVLGLLVRDVAQRVREVLAETIAGSANLPQPVAVQLARDAVAVARPVLERSLVLADDDLIAIVRTNAMQYALAVAARDVISEDVTEALVATGERQVVARVVANAGARFSQATLQRVVEDWRTDRTIHDRLVRRPELPFELVDQLVGIVGDRLEWELVRSRTIAPDEARALMRATRERATISMVSRDHGERALERRIRERIVAGELSHETILRFLKEGDVASFEMALALLARIEPPRCRRLVYHSDRRFLAAVCLRAGVPTAHYLTLRMALELAEDAVAHSGHGRAYAAETVQFLHDQYARLRRDPAEIDRLCFG
ncbi:MAG: DUF2336 domain-containing protein [Geminicoccaceae bacterium]